MIFIRTLLLTFPILLHLSELSASGINQGGLMQHRGIDMNTVPHTLLPATSPYSSHPNPHFSDSNPWTAPPRHHSRLIRKLGLKDVSPTYYINYQGTDLGVWTDHEGNPVAVSLGKDNFVPQVQQRKTAKVEERWVDQDGLKFSVHYMDGQLVGATLTPSHTVSPGGIDPKAFKQVRPLTPDPNRPSSIFPFRNRMIGVWKNQNGKVSKVEFVPHNEGPPPEDIFKHKYRFEYFYEHNIRFYVWVQEDNGRMWKAGLDPKWTQ